MKKTSFGTVNGVEYSLYSFTNQNQVTMEVTDLGATIVRLFVPDRDGICKDVVLGYDDAQGYVDGTCYFGAVIGRSGNRIGKACFEINGTKYQLAVNDNENNLHSGPDGYDMRKWEVEEINEETNSIRMGLLSPDLDQGYPGEFKVSITYTLTEQNEVVLHYEGVSNADTIANLTNHSYFNLGGHASGKILDHELKMTTKAYTAVADGQAIPTGELTPVAGTPMDFTEAKPIGKEIDADYEQLTFVGGYDHNFVITDKTGTMQTFAEAVCPATGIKMTVSTDCCGVQFYSGNFVLNQKGKEGVVYNKRDGFCLETQFYPDAINKKEFPSPLLRAGDKYDTTTIYQFSVVE